MTLYIVKNGQRLGPYTVAEAQALVVAGTVKENDWAWYEGLPNWVPLKQVPGFVTPVIPGQRPVLVWLICIYTLLSAGYFLFTWATLLTMTRTDLTTNPPTHTNLLASIGYFQISALLLKLILTLVWAVLFFLLRRRSLFVYIGSLVVGGALLGYNLIATGGHMPFGLFVNLRIAITWVLDFAILAYNWHLCRRGVLH